VIGICGGLQMLGRTISDPHGVEGIPGTSAGLGLLDIDTELTQDKRLAQTTGRCVLDPDDHDATVAGYEIHMGVSTGAALDRPVFTIGDRPEGARSADDQILGTYLHGLFDTPQACAALLRWAGLHNADGIDLAQLRENSIDRIADAAEPLLTALLAHAASCAGEQNTHKAKTP
jgi:adenosylcobyric acid synthase